MSLKYEPSLEQVIALLGLSDQSPAEKKLYESVQHFLASTLPPGERERERERDRERETEIETERQRQRANICQGLTLALTVLYVS